MLSKKTIINIQKNVFLAPYTTFKIGGSAKFFTEAKNEQEFVASLEYAKKKSLAFFVLGGGSNILINDRGFNGLVIRMRNAEYDVGNTEIKCGAGADLFKIVIKSAENGLTGLEWAAGIPGTVGGAIRGNAGAFGGEISNLVKNVKIFDTKDLRLKIYDFKRCNFDYRSSVFKENGKLIIISAVLKMKKGNTKEIRKKIKETIRKRKAGQPAFPSAGSFFQNPAVKDRELVDKFEKDTEMKAKNGKIPAGWLIERSGLKGKRVGGARVSEKHANFIVNIGKASAEDVIILSSLIKQKVRTRFKIQLKEEVQYVGF